MDASALDLITEQLFYSDANFRALVKALIRSYDNKEEIDDDLMSALKIVENSHRQAVDAALSFLEQKNDLKDSQSQKQAV